MYEIITRCFLKLNKKFPFYTIEQSYNEKQKEINKKDLGEMILDDFYYSNGHFIGTILYTKMKDKYNKNDILRLNKMIKEKDTNIYNDEMFKDFESEIESIVNDLSAIEYFADDSNSNNKGNAL